MKATHSGELPAAERMQTRQVFVEVQITFIDKPAAGSTWDSEVEPRHRNDADSSASQSHGY
jgi:hypothetical protein